MWASSTTSSIGGTLPSFLFWNMVLMSLATTSSLGLPGTPTRFMMVAFPLSTSSERRTPLSPKIPMRWTSSIASARSSRFGSSESTTSCSARSASVNGTPEAFSISRVLFRITWILLLTLRPVMDRMSEALRLLVVNCSLFSPGLGSGEKTRILSP